MRARPDGQQGLRWTSPDRRRVAHCSLAFSLLLTTGVTRPGYAAAHRAHPRHATKSVGTRSPTARPASVIASHPEEMKVTATRTLSRRQILMRQNDPVAVTTITEHDLQSHQITNIQQAVKLLPAVSLQITNPRNTAINVRGLGNFSSSAQDGLENGTAVYIDGVYQTRPGAVLGDISDLSGMEVLKGPQATRGGVDNDGGAINITTLAPSFTRGYSVTGDYGSYNTANVRLRATGPVGSSDKVAFSLSGFSINHDGYVKNVTTGRDYQDYHDLGVKGQLLAVPTDRLTLRLIADYSHLRESCCVTPFSTALTHYANGATVMGNYWQRAAFAGAEPLPAHGIRDMLVALPATGSQAVDQETYGLSLDVTYRLSHGWKLENIAAWHAWFWYPHNGFSGGLGTTPGLRTLTAGNNQVYEQHATEEIRISSPEGRRFHVSAGAFYMYEEVPDYTRWQISAQGAKYYGYGLSPATYNSAYNGALFTSSDNPITNDLAGYVRARYDITSKLSLEGGFRYSFVTKSGSYTSTIVNSSNPALAAGVLGAATSYHASHRENEPSGTLSLVYRPTGDNFVYATYSRGLRNGGINLVSLNIAQGANPDVKPEIDDMFEVGSKNAFFNRRLLVNFDAFWNNVHDYITSAAYYTSAGTTISYLTNARHVVSRGFELETRGTILPGLEGRLSASYTDAFFASFNNASHPLESSNVPGLYSLTGNQIPLNSRWNLSAGLEYTTRLGNIGNPSSRFWRRLIFFVGADYTYRSSYYADASESAYTRIRPYGLLDGHIGIRPESGKWDLSFWGHNMLDKRYFITMTPLAAGAVFYGQLGDPAMFGGEFSYRL
ncbi:TonB-dependent receptor [Komagataeibacter sp. FNDCR2]|uniref:TonB-dependent receptor n=1 Tax=Komagataeibacter sp. FNDCR2 TaxID=2878682 RepID=UPI001E535C33|nr:TonB-dependent receptor [Komagataeibacter sp. FNDCR2]MCE2575246.1 TonB-dependent receptor [Komagataeibacter sp. FNDCR2]